MILNYMNISRDATRNVHALKVRINSTVLRVPICLFPNQAVLIENPPLSQQKEEYTDFKNRRMSLGEENKDNRISRKCFLNGKLAFVISRYSIY